MQGERREWGGRGDGEGRGGEEKGRIIAINSLHVSNFAQYKRTTHRRLLPMTHYRATPR